ncbi:hypothetical protein SAMN05216573_12914 [Bradyrhizobium sp. Rc3b]|nr:hypothetical protein SAMN05216573_12914 [Bradyrhizobium sp. Rc3b]
MTSKATNNFSSDVPTRAVTMVRDQAGETLWHSSDVDFWQIGSATQR